MKLIRETIQGFKSLLIGMKVTIREFFSPVITVQYPRQTLPTPERYRGHIELKWNEETGRANCTACGICAKACPSACIVLDGIKPEGEKKKTVTSYHLNYTLCSLCSLCVEACPFDAIQHSKRYNLASGSNPWADMDLVERYRQQVIKAGKTPFIPVPPPPAAPAAGPKPEVSNLKSEPPPAAPAQP